MRDPRVKATPEGRAKSLEGNGRKELLFVWKQELETHHHFQGKIRPCDPELQKHLPTLSRNADPQELREVQRNKRPHGNGPENLDLREELYRITGVD